GNRLPMIVPGASVTNGHEFSNEREILYKLFFDMKKDVTELKKMFVEILQNPSLAQQHASIVKELNEIKPQEIYQPAITASQPVMIHNNNNHINDIHEHEVVDESLNIMDKEKELIIKALKKHKGKRKDASSDLGISERTLYRKLKEYDIDDL
ncbi:MAG: helix-turn-helix domain-containing protein, partial [Bacteroidetes bacterium]|nr:helix-turn-helix domain-containing protein [Bacteroidota bacterium]